MSKVKSVIRYVLAIILTLAIILFSIINIASFTIINKAFVLKKLEETSYYNKIYSYTKSNFENYIYQSGLDETVLENVITEEQVKSDTEKIITNIYNSIEEDISVDDIKERLSNNIEKVTGDNKLTEAQKQSIDSFIDEICKEYIGSISHFKYEKEIYKIISKIKVLSDYGKKAALIIIGVSVIGLILLSWKRIYKAVSFIGIALLSSGLFMFLLHMYINKKIRIQGITILNEAFSFSLREILETTLKYFQIDGWILISIGMVFIIIPSLIHNIIKYYNTSNKRKKKRKAS